MNKRIFLEDIVAKKRERNKKINYNIECLKKEALKIQNKPSLVHALKKEELSIIGEVKKASPSKGIIKEDFNPLEIAEKYNKSVDAISVLTEEDYFLGKKEYLKKISQNVEIPIICKDFIIEEGQIYEAKLLGASGILLIVAILTNKQLSHFINIADNLELDCLVEVHTLEELNRALEVDARIIGINNRNLKTFDTDINTTLNLRKYIPSNKIVVSESGITSKEDIRKLKKVGIDGILVGESFMKSKDIIAFGKELKNEYKS